MPALFAAAMLASDHPAIGDGAWTHSARKQTDDVLANDDPRQMTTVGILGGGQLARMLALSGAPLGLRFLVMDTVADACAGQFAPMVVGDYRDERALAEFASQGRRRHVRFRERAGRIRAVAGRARAGVPEPARAGDRRRTGWPRRPCSATSASRCRISPRSTSRDGPRRRDRADRHAVHPQDPPPGLRRQGPVPHQDAGRCRRGVGRAGRAGGDGRPDPRRLRAVRARARRSSPCAAATASSAPGR